MPSAFWMRVTYTFGTWTLTVEDHAGALLDKDKTALGGYPRAALDHLARIHLRRIMGANDAGRPSTEDAVAELENVLRLVK